MTAKDATALDNRLKQSTDGLTPGGPDPVSGFSDDSVCDVQLAHMLIIADARKIAFKCNSACLGIRYEKA